MGLKILHLSDIHFRHRVNGHWAVEQDLQNELIMDLDRLISGLNGIDIVLIGGDVAFSGSQDEYDLADKWIAQVCKSIHCKIENVLTIPGNHDVERAKVITAVHALQRQLKIAGDQTERNKLIAGYYSKQESANLLLSPFSNYLEFAQKYNSVPPGGQNNLFWERDFKHGNHLFKIRGVNSAIVSNKDDEIRNSLMVLGTFQSLIPSKRGVINLALCHHPPEWMYDCEDVKKDFRSRARIQLFGHVHSFDVVQLNNSLILSAGAMQPPEGEPGWEPRYNVLELDLIGDDNSRKLNVKLFRRKWNTATRHFEPEYDDHGKSWSEYNLELSADERHLYDFGAAEIEKNINNPAMAESVTDLSKPDPLKVLARLFWTMPYVTKTSVAVKLGLVEEVDKDLTEIQRVQAYFRRAVEKGLQSKLWDLVMKETGQQIQNPF